MVNSKLLLFEDKKIRRTWHEEEWYFSIVDVVESLTDSLDAKDYWYRLKKRMREEERFEISTFCRQLKIQSTDGKKYLTETANVEGLFRIIQD